VNRIGIVTGAGRSYEIAVMTVYQPTEAYAIATIDSVSRIVWDTINQAP